jgi:four helix bundle protein
VQDFKKLLVWQKSHLLTLEIYSISKTFPNNELFGLTSQLRRASSSVAANIAEGCGRKSKNEFAHFLAIAIGSVSEVEYFLILARDLNYLSKNDFQRINSLANETKRMLISFVNRVEKQ